MAGASRQTRAAYATLARHYCSWRTSTEERYERHQHCTGRKVMISKGRAVRLAVIAFALLLGGCTSKPAPSSSPSSPPVALRSASPSPSDVRAAAVQAGVDAYRGMWQAYNDAIKIPDPNTPDLPKFATGKALTTLIGALK